MLKSKKAQTIVIVLVFLLIVTILTTVTMNTISSYYRSIASRIENLRTTVYIK